MTARVFVTLKKAVLDPQRKAVQGALAKLGYPEARDVRVGRTIEITLEAKSKEEAAETPANLAVLHVTKPWRRHGVRCELTNEVVRLARAEGVQRLYVSATPTRGVADHENLPPNGDGDHRVSEDGATRFAIHISLR